MKDQSLSPWTHTYEIWITALEDTYRGLVQGAAALVPSLLGATLLLLVGWLLALLLRLLIMRVGTGLDRLFDSARVRAGRSAIELRWPASRVVAYTVYWLVILFFIAAAANLLGLPRVADLFGAILVYLPILLLIGGALFGVYLLSGLIADLVEGAARSTSLAHAALMGRLARIFIMVLAVIIAVGQLGIDVTLLVNVVTILAAMLFGGAALAFGIGAAGTVGNIVSSHYVRRLYQVGQRVRIDGVDGEVLEITPVTVVLDTREGRALVPARVFSEKACVVLEDTDDDA